MKLILVALVVCLGTLCSARRSDVLRRFDGSLKAGVKTVYYQPEQIHLSYGADASEIIVTWLTMNDTFESVVEMGFAPNQMNTVVRGENATVYQDGGSEKRTFYVHRVRLTDLVPLQYYWYHCGSEMGWSSTYFFESSRNDANWGATFAVFGDLGNVNGQSIPRLQQEVQKGMYDAILHVGDMAYDMDTDNARVGDEFLRQIQPIAAYVPYMTCPGNHENAYNFSNYDHRFTMISQRENVISNHFFSFDLGNAHIISFSTEFYFYLQYGVAQVGNQFEWLENDLKEATKPENLALHPWIITMGHRPMYCSNDDQDDCTSVYSWIRHGYNGRYALEPLFYKYGVDLEFWAHEHSYERSWPLYNYTVYNGSMEEPYTNPGAPVHIITGSAGCQEEHDYHKNITFDWSAFRGVDYGFSRLYIINDTHLRLEQVSDDKDGQIIDEMWLIQENHGPRV